MVSEEHLGRRISKRVTETLDGQQPTASHQHFVYDGWNLVAELDATGRAHRTHLWGLDLSGTPQGAGGVGGLISTATTANDQAVFISFDGNGNITGELECDFGRTVATASCDAFGNVATQTGESVSSFAFSTKFLDAETEFLYYGYRYYDPVTGRWQNRDPIVEAGGPNLYGFVENAPLDRFDILGMVSRWYTLGFDADAYGIVPFYLTVGWTSPWFIDGSVGASIEVVVNCRDGSANAFGTAMIGVGVGMPGIGVSTGKGLNFIYNLSTASDYAGHFVGVTIGATLGALGGYGSGFTTPKGAENLLKSGEFGEETFGFGAGWVAGTPSAGILFQYEYFWDLGRIAFSSEQRMKFCRCVNNSSDTIESNRTNVIRAEIKRFAREAGQTVKAALKARLKKNIPASTSQSRANAAIDAADWEMP